jgi:DNA-binding transcriptional ArsR family regulator/uncharacterized protein YndB with AHSA1/START domain
MFNYGRRVNVEFMVNDDIVQLFKALAHPSRVEILDHLKNGPMSTGELSDKFQVSRYAIMKHLNILEETGLVLVRRHGRLRLNHLNVIPLQSLYNRWVSKYESNISTSLMNLKEKIEADEGRKLKMENIEGKLELGSFQIEQEIVIDAPIHSVFDGLTENINDWWAFRLGENKDSKMIFEPKLNGRFYEDWGNGQGVLWGTVIHYNAPEEIKLVGLLGMKGAVNSNYSYKLEEKGSSTVLKLTHHAMGLLEPQWEEAHRHGWNELLNNLLKGYVEKKTKAK